MDEFVSCPYNRQHRVPRSRIQAHIVKCEEKYPKLEICPYNATHRYPKEEIKKHLKVCPARESFVLEEILPKTNTKTNAILTTPNIVPQQEHFDPEDEEYWD